jgi:hypothetical protein
MARFPIAQLDMSYADLPASMGEPCAGFERALPREFLCFFSRFSARRAAGRASAQQSVRDDRRGIRERPRKVAFRA